jgi:tyrosyl-tRNA synthetase
VQEHEKAPQERILQKRLAEEITVMVHSRGDYESAVEASQILFGKGTTESLKRMNESTFLAVFEGVPVFDVKKDILKQKVKTTDLLAGLIQVFASKGELRRMVQGGGLSINKEKIIDPEMMIGIESLLNEKYILVQKGKKNYYLLRII